MWESIVSNIVSSIGVSLCTNYMNQQHREEFEQRLARIVNDSFTQYADTSLDRNEFALFVRSVPFMEMLRNYFFLLSSGEEKDTYLCTFMDEIHRQCPTADSCDIRSFINNIENIYTSFLQQEVRRVPEIDGLYQLLLMSQKQLLRKIQASQNTMEQYFEVMQNRVVQITDEDILSYHRICAKEFGVVRFTGISGVEGKSYQDIEQFYVENQFSYCRSFNTTYIYNNDDYEDDDNNETHNNFKLGLKSFFDGGNRVVLIGGAGLGKSTSLNYLFCKYEELYHAFALKLKIDLKDYASDISDKHHGILWCLATEFSKRIPANKLAFEEVSTLLAEYLVSGKCLVIFDALDEIPVQASRNKVRDEISTFCDVYYSNRFIISTREVGYLRNCFDKDFIHIWIKEFEMKQIKQYSENWLKVNHEDQKFEDFWKRFELELRRAKCQDLIRNPMILILALVIFDVQNSLPNRRVEFYKRCIDTFLITREDRRNAFVQTVDFKNILGDSSVVPKIAHYKFEKINENMGYRFTHEELKEAIMQAIDVPNRRQWYEPAALFARYLIERTELIQETDEDVLDFAHKTFYEYFLAVYYAQEYETERLLDLIYAWIGDPHTDEMARLIIEVIVEKNDAKQHRAVIEFLLTPEVGLWKEDSFDIISELYAHNVLQAKYHDQYYNCILHDAMLAKYLSRKQSLENEGFMVYYNKQRMAELFLENVEQNSSSLYSMIGALKYLNSKFTDSLVSLSGDERYQKIAQLFSNAAGISLKMRFDFRERQIRERQALYDFFITEPSGIFLYSPEIYLSLIPAALEGNSKGKARFFDFRFKKNNMCLSYISTFDLFQMFARCFESPENLLLFMIAIIHCAYNDTSVFSRIILKDEEPDDKYINDVLLKAKQNAFLVSKHFFEKQELETWLTQFREKSLYLEQYEKLYVFLFDEYISFYPKGASKITTL